MQSRKKLYRSQDKMLGGVCAGVADYFDIDPSIARLLFAFFVLCGGGGILLYIIMWIIVPEQIY